MKIAFDELSDAEAHAFFDAFVECMPARLAQFKCQVADEGGPAAEELDETPASLVPLWRWFVALFDAVRERERP